MKKFKFAARIVLVALLILCLGCAAARAEELTDEEIGAMEQQAEAASRLWLSIPAIKADAEFLDRVSGENGERIDYYLYEGVVELELERLAPVESELVEYVAEREGIGAEEVELEEDEVTSEKLTYPSYRLFYITKSDGQEKWNIDLYVRTDTCDLRMHAAMPMDAQEEYAEEIIGWIYNVDINVYEFALGETYTADDGYEYVSYGTYPHIAGIAPLETMQAAFAYEMLDILQQDLYAFITTSDKELILQDFVNRYLMGNASLFRDGESIQMEYSPYDLLLLTELGENELEYISDSGESIIQQQIAEDALVFYVPEDNPVDSLTVEQLKAVFSGEISNWSELGGNDEAIVVYLDYEAKDLMAALVMDGEEIIEPPQESMFIPSGVDEEDGGSSEPYEVEFYSEYDGGPGSICFGFLSYIQYQDGLKILDVEDVMPNIANLEAYPLRLSYYAVCREEEEFATPGNFINWLTSEEGRELIAAYGYGLPQVVG